MINENAVIVTDFKIAETLKKSGVDVLCLKNSPDIKLLDAQGNYSKMNGFIGGAITRVEDKVIVFGDLGKIDKTQQILNFVKKYNLELVDFKGLDVIDYGGLIII